MEPKATSTTSKKMVGLPLTVTGPVDLGRLIREIDAIDNALLQARLGPNQTLKIPKTSIFMDQTVQLNKLDLNSADDRAALKKFLAAIRDRGPRLHVSFSADPSEQFLNKFTLWLRKSVHPLVLVTVGLQPGIGAGCMVRTTNKYFDFSLAKQLSQQRPLLMQKLQEQTVDTPAVAEPTPVSEAAA